MDQLEPADKQLTSRYRRHRLHQRTYTVAYIDRSSSDAASRYQSCSARVTRHFGNLQPSRTVFSVNSAGIRDSLKLYRYRRQGREESSQSYTDCGTTRVDSRRQR